MKTYFYYAWIKGEDGIEIVNKVRAHNKKEAYEILKQGHPELKISDIKKSTQQY